MRAMVIKLGMFMVHIGLIVQPTPERSSRKFAAWNDGPKSSALPLYNNLAEAPPASNEVTSRPTTPGVDKMRERKPFHSEGPANGTKTASAAGPEAAWQVLLVDDDASTVDGDQRICGPQIDRQIGTNPTA